MAEDYYAKPKAALRENVKTLIAAFSGVAGFLLAGAPFSGYGALELGSVRWYVASISILTALAIFGWCVNRLLFVLRPDLTYYGELSDRSPDGEMKLVQDAFAKHASELLPEDCKSLADLSDKERKTWDAYEKNPGDKDLEKQHAVLRNTQQQIIEWAGFIRLHIRVTEGVRKTLRLGLVAVIAIGFFALAVAPKKESAEKPSIYVVAAHGVSPQPASAATLPKLAPVLFATGSAALAPESIDRVREARDILRANTGAGILAIGHTDTVGGLQLNEHLAKRRLEAVSNLLRSAGGVSESRIFTAVLAKRDLPKLTAADVAEQTNRSVELILFPLPTR